LKKVERLTKKSLSQILNGKISSPQPALFVVKFYSVRCHYCHALQRDYIDLAEKHKDVYFFAFNIDDQPGIQKVIGFEGVPTICTVLVGEKRPKVKIIPDPSEPHPKKWYHVGDINSFINKEKNQNEY
tara:strand:- start:28 stop:411 length:384 start_codon:yes stop_codon:yes gene_type:complete